jgi:hypothetical protein
LPIASGEPGIGSKITIWQDATAYVARLESQPLRYALSAGRLAFLFAAGGDVAIDGEPLRPGDAVRLTGPAPFEITGTGEVVLWDVPPLAATRSGR